MTAPHPRWWQKPCKGLLQVLHDYDECIASWNSNLKVPIKSVFVWRPHLVYINLFVSTWMSNMVSKVQHLCFSCHKILLYYIYSVVWLPEVMGKLGPSFMENFSPVSLGIQACAGIFSPVSTYRARTFSLVKWAGTFHVTAIKFHPGLWKLLFCLYNFIWVVEKIGNRACCRVFARLQQQKAL